jgi:hypothetical protein
MFKMLRLLLNALLDMFENDSKKKSDVDNKVIQMVDEINELEIKHASALADVERWGDITDTSDWRTVEYNRIGRIIEAKKRMLDTLRHRI